MCVSIVRPLSLVCLLLLSALTSAGTIDRTADADQYLRLLQSDRDYVRLQVIKELGWVGITDPRLFDLVADRVEAEAFGRLDEARLSVMYWGVLALAGSGAEEYVPLLNRLVEDAAQSEIKAAAAQAIAHMPVARQWNLIINDDSRVNSVIPPFIVMFLNMLNADDLALKKLALEQIQLEGLSNQYVLDDIAGQIRSNYSNNSTEEIWVETVTLACRVLIEIGGSGYVDVVKAVARKSPNAELRHAVKKVLRDSSKK
ncbi:MAG: hypothetical protein V7711_06975 [Pseudomonadales bacterium]